MKEYVSNFAAVSCLGCGGLWRKYLLRILWTIIFFVLLLNAFGTALTFSILKDKL